MSRLGQDLRHALRACLRAPLVSTLAVVAFALGIGVTTAVFSIFYNVLLKPLPFRDPEQLVMVYDTQPACDTCPASYPKYHDWKARNHVFSAIGGSTPAGFVLSGQGEPVQVPAARRFMRFGSDSIIRTTIARWCSKRRSPPTFRIC